MMARAEGRSPLDRFRCFETTDLDEAREIVARHFCSHRLECVSRTDPFDARQNRVTGQRLSLNYIRYGADVTIDPGELTDFYLIQIPITGAASVENGLQSAYSTPEKGTVLNPDRHTKMRWHTGCEQVLLQVEQSFMHEVAVRMTGTPVSVVRFATELDLRDPALAAWGRKLRGIFKGAEDGCVFGGTGDCQQRVLEETLVASLIDSQPNTVTPLLGRAGSGAAPAILKRATAMINERLADDIGLLDISAFARTTPRNLQILFKREFGCSPIQYLQNLRLAFARHLLISGPDTLSIADIAHASGHRHFGRFSVTYKRRFGETPRGTRRDQKFA